jgi:hypothetical protein
MNPLMAAAFGFTVARSWAIAGATITNVKIAQQMSRRRAGLASNLLQFMSRVT